MITPTGVPNPFRRRRANFNSLKLRALEALENRGWLNPPVWAALVGFYPARAAYTYLRRLWHMRLLVRGRRTNGLIFSRLSSRGKKRLQWSRDSHGTLAETSKEGR